MDDPGSRRRTALRAGGIAIAMTIVLLASLTLPSPASAGLGADDPVSPDSATVDASVATAIEQTGTAQVIVEFDSPTAAGHAAADDRVDGAVLDADEPLVAATVDADALDALVEAPGSQVVVTDREHTVALADSVDAVDAPDAWTSGATGDGQRVAILDTGVLASHPFLAGRVTDQACFSGDATDTWASGLCPGIDTHEAIGGDAASPCALTISSSCAHGTHVAGIAAGSDGPVEAPSGVAPGADIVAVQVFSRSGTKPGRITARDSDLLEALSWVAAQQNASSPIAAVNMSLGGHASSGYCDARGSDAILKAQIDALADVGIAVVAASGNDDEDDGIAGKAHLHSPACISTVIAVGATDDARNVADWSMSWSPLDLLAPGVGIMSSKFSGSSTPTYAESKGTSMAAPHVTGALAVLADARGTLPVTAALEALTRSGIPTEDPANHLVRPFIQIQPALSVPLTPLGAIDSTTSSGGAVSISGWALDPDTFGAAEVELRVGGVPAERSTASDSRPDIGVRHPSFGPLHGFTIEAGGLTSGSHSVCLSVLDTTTSVRTQLSCDEVVVTGGSSVDRSPFSDVSPGDQFYEAVTWLSGTGITSGYPDGTFQPGETVTRQTMAAFSYRLAGSPTYAPPLAPTFSDVAIGAPFRKEIEWAAANDITLGNPDGTFRPRDAVSRQSFAAFLYRYDDPDTSSLPTLATFADVPVGHVFREQVEWLASNGIADGRGYATFAPHDPVSRQALAAFLARYQLPA